MARRDRSTLRPARGARISPHVMTAPIPTAPIMTPRIMGERTTWHVYSA
jgi:hypothetical protein